MARFEVTKNNGEVVDGEKFYRDRYKIPDGVIVRDENISYKLGHYKGDLEMAKIIQAHTGYNYLTVEKIGERDGNFIYILERSPVIAWEINRERIPKPVILGDGYDDFYGVETPVGCYCSRGHRYEHIETLALDIILNQILEKIEGRGIVIKHRNGSTHFSPDLINSRRY